MPAPVIREEALVQSLHSWAGTADESSNTVDDDAMHLAVEWAVLVALESIAAAQQFLPPLIYYHHLQLHGRPKMSSDFYSISEPLTLDVWDSNHSV